MLQGEACDRRGAIILARKDPSSFLADKTERWVLGTVCKTWRCPTCRLKRHAMVKMRIVYGCTTLAASWFITLTYARDAAGNEDALSVGRDWYRFLRRLKTTNPNLCWFRVIELTKKSQPHLHLIVGGLETANELTIERDFRDAWAMATRRRGAVQSFIVKAIKVQSAHKAAGYMAKYMVKAFYDHRLQLEQMGFLRRFSRSRNWPSPAPLHLEGLVNGTLINLGYRARYELTPQEQLSLQEAQEVYPEALARTGDDLAIALGYRLNRMTPLNKLKGRITDVSTQASTVQSTTGRDSRDR